MLPDRTIINRWRRRIVLNCLEHRCEELVHRTHSLKAQTHFERTQARTLEKHYSRIESIGPAPTRNDIWFVHLECGSNSLNVRLWAGTGGYDVDVPGNPRQIKGNQR